MDVPQLALSAFAEKCNSQKLDMPTMCESTNLLQQRVHDTLMFHNRYLILCQ